jgi:hypothetical protein
MTRHQRNHPPLLVGILALLVVITLTVPCAVSAQRFELDPGSTHLLTTDALLDTLQHTAFDYFWNEANPSNGLIRDRSTAGSACSVAAVGFGLTAIAIGIDHGWITRAQGRDRVLTTLITFWNGPQGPDSSGMIGYKGLFYHFLDMTTATRTWSSELSTIDSALLFAGVLDVKQYFSTSDADEIQIRALADSLYQRADWEFSRNSGPGIRMGWKPITGFSGFGTWVGYNEATILYLLALGSPTHPIPPSTWFTWTSGYNWSTQYGYEYLVFPPLFGHQYSHCWVDFRNIADIYMTSKGSTYFENSRRATLAARAYCIDNPGGWIGYGPDLWGLTASDDPTGYVAHGAPPAQSDNGTITPTAAASSIAFAPEVVIPALHHMYDVYGSQIWSTYGFLDAFNPSVSWVGTDYLGIDQGPIIIMIENYRNQSVWNRFMLDESIQSGLTKAGFNTITAVDDRSVGIQPAASLFQNFPNPFGKSSMISYRLATTGWTSLIVYDVRGRQVQVLVDRIQSAGIHNVVFNGRDLPSGVYYYRLHANGEQIGKTCTLLR